MLPLYTLLLYQDLIKTKQVANDELLPPVFPVVLYNGSKRWDSATQLSNLIVDLPGGLERYKPSFEYLLLDEGKYELSELEHLNNLVAAIFRLENAKSPEEINDVINKLIEWLKSPEQECIRRSFVTWIKRVLPSDKEMKQYSQSINNLTEIRIMLAERVSQWQKEWSQQALREGLEQGLEQGLDNEKLLLYRLISKRYGNVVYKKALPKIQDIKSTKELEQIGDWILDCQTDDEFLDKLLSW